MAGGPAGHRQADRYGQRLGRGYGPEAIGQDEALASSQLAQPSEAQQAALAIADQQGWTAGPVFAQDPPGGPRTPAAGLAAPEPPPTVAPDFYGGHVVAPDFGAMADASDGTEAGAQS